MHCLGLPRYSLCSVWSRISLLFQHGLVFVGSCYLLFLSLFLAHPKSFFVSPSHVNGKQRRKRRPPRQPRAARRSKCGPWRTAWRAVDQWTERGSGARNARKRQRGSGCGDSDKIHQGCVKEYHVGNHLQHVAGFLNTKVKKWKPPFTSANVQVYNVRIPVNMTLPPARQR